MLDRLQDILLAAGLVGSTWGAEQAAAGELVALYRQYYAGEHRLKLTAEMKKMMQIGDARLDRYNDNYCEMVVDALADRLVLDTVKPMGATDDAAAAAWLENILTVNRMDATQIALHEAVLRDGVAYVMVQYVDGLGALLAVERAWDGVTGILPVWDSTGEYLLSAVKVWREADVTRVNIYYPDKTDKYTYADGSLRLVVSEDTRRDGVAPGVPLVAFKNRGGGRSELVNVIPLQDSLNRTLASMVMSAELTAFSLLFAVGFEPPSGITPGMVIHASINGADGGPVVTDSRDEAAAYAALMGTYKLERISAGDLSQLIGQAEFLIEQIATVSSTPVPSQMGGASSSGEALKQRDIRLQGKARRAQVQIGNAWEDVFALARVQQELFGVTLPPLVTGFNAKWKSAEIRNDADVREMAKLLHEWGYEREALRVLSASTLADYSEDDITRLMDEKARDSEVALGALAGTLPGFE